MGALLGYEAAKVLLSGLSHAQNRKDLARTIHNLNAFEGVQHQLVFNEGGVAVRPLLHRTIHNGRIITVQAE